MALEKETSACGIQANYWHIYKLTYNKDNNTTLARLRCYVNKATRDNDINDYLQFGEFMKAISLDGELDVDEAYAALKTQQTTVGDGENAVTTNGYFYGATDA